MLVRGLREGTKYLNVVKFERKAHLYVLNLDHATPLFTLLRKRFPRIRKWRHTNVFFMNSTTIIRKSIELFF